MGCLAEDRIGPPHPNPRQPLHALLYLVHPCTRLPEGEGGARERDAACLDPILFSNYFPYRSPSGLSVAYDEMR
jgi:hypothetical protein